MICNDDFVALIRYLLVDHGLTQYDVANAIGISEATVSKWFTGKASITIIQQYAIIHFFYKTLNDEELKEIDAELEAIVNCQIAIKEMSAKVKAERKKKRIKSVAEQIKEQTAIFNAIDEKYDAYQERASTDEWIAAITRRIPINEQGRWNESK